VQKANTAAVMTPTDEQKPGISEEECAAAGNAAAAMSPMDNMPIDPTIQAQLDSLSGDLDQLVALYHPEAVVILNKSLARILQSEGTAIGQAKVKALLQCQINVGISDFQLHDYVQGKDLAVLQSTQTIRGQAYQAFAYYLLRDGKIWRYVAGVYDTADQENAAMPANVHPVFMEQMGFMATGDVDGLARTYDPSAIWVWGATNSPIARVRGASEGSQNIRDYLVNYLKVSMQMVGLKEYTQADDTLFVQGIMTAMTAKGKSEHAAGIYVFRGNKILRQASSCGPRV
jgi:hypothetical protein